MFRRLSAIVVCFCAMALGQSAPLQVRVVDENGLAVGNASVELRGPETLRCSTDAAGQCRLTAAPGSYELTASKVGFYEAVLHDVRAAETAQLQLTLAHTQEVKESVEVSASPPAIDPEQIASIQSLGNTEIINIPFPVTRDIRQALPYIPGVVRDRTGQVHVAGAETYQSLTLLDGFLISDPATGTLNTRFSTDAVRAIDVQSTRYSAQFGPASGGVTAFTSMSGDDRLRFSATNFIPSLQFKQGTHIDKITPRATFSGPLVKGRAWFLLAPDGEYDNNIVSELPPGQNRNPVWRLSNLAKVQVNLTRTNVFTSTFLVNDLRSSYGGVSPFTPIETTLREQDSSYIATARDQIYLGGALVEAGVAISRYHHRALPLGASPYVISPGIAHGNYYRSDWVTAGRLEPQLNVYLPRYRFHGSHEVRFGAVARDSHDDETSIRTPISILRADGTIYSRMTFSNPPRARVSDTVYGGFLEDRWSPAERLLVELGIRADRDTAIGEATLSPRIAATYMLTAVTKLSTGIGLFRDYPTLEMLARSRQGIRSQFIYDASGNSVVGPPATSAFVLPRRLRSPESRNWSVSIERQLGPALFVSAEYIDRHTTRDFAYEYSQATALMTEFRLGNNRSSQYRAFQVSGHRTFHEGHEVMLAYTRSSARASAVLDYSLDVPVFSPQAAGPLAWDAPNKVVSWGFLPVPHLHKFSFGYSAEWHSGFPFTVFNQYQQVAGGANSRRFPDRVMISPFVERRFSLKSYNLAVRGGFEDVTGSRNPVIVQNNIDAANFLQYAFTAHRAFTARIRFLGRK